MQIDRQQLQNLIRQIALSTLPPLLHLLKREYKSDGSIVTLADKAMQDAITQQLAEIYPAIPLLGEEMTAEAQQALLDSGQPFWCLDPIDGTSNLASGMPFYVISLALVVNQQAQIGVVYDPNRDELFSAEAGQGAWLNDQRLLIQPVDLPLRKTIAFVDFKRLPVAFATQLIQHRPYGSQRNLGSIALELCWLAAGRAHLYLHGDQHIWDYAAAELIAREAGAHSCTLSGLPLVPNALKEQSSLAAIDINLFTQWRDHLQAIHAAD